MDLEIIETKIDPEIGYETTVLDAELKTKSALRIKYEAQVSVIKDQIGSLETVRKELNLSQRQMAQLLMVDPSAWTRWNRPGEDAPAHIYRALQWYMALIDKIPGLSPYYFIQKDPRILSEIQKKLESEKANNDVLSHLVQQNSKNLQNFEINYEQQIVDLKNQIQFLTQLQSKQRFWIYTLMVFLLAISLSLLFSLSN